MALYIGEEGAWKCPKHPPKRRGNTTGICPACLRDRLRVLCPNCAKIRPCSCSAASSSSSTSASLFAPFSSSARITVGRVGSLIESEPKMERSRSFAIPFARSRLTDTEKGDSKALSRSFWWTFKTHKTQKGETETETETIHNGEEIKNCDNESCYYDSKIGEFEKMIMKSRSMRAPIPSEKGGGDEKSPSKGKSWYFPSPIKVFRHRSKVVQDRSPLQRY